MAARNRGSSAAGSEDSYEDEDYSDDFDDEPGGNRRFKTRSPLLRSEHKHKQRPQYSGRSDDKVFHTDKHHKTTKGREDDSHQSQLKRSQSKRYLSPEPSCDLYLYSNASTIINSKDSGSNTLASRTWGSRGSGTCTESEFRPKPSQPAVYRHQVIPQSAHPHGGRVFNRTTRGRGGRWVGQSRNSHPERYSSEPKIDNIAKRVMSARRLKINELRNRNEELNQTIKDIKEENKLLKKTHMRHEKALKKFEDKESDLPQLIQRQNNEVRSLKDQIRKWREKFEKSDRYLRDAEDELEKVKYKLKRINAVADEKELPERSELNRRLTQSELDIEERDVKIRELEKHIQNLQKNHRHELGIEMARQRDANKQLQQLRDNNDKLSVTVQEKEKQIHLKNIYANRMIKGPPLRQPISYNGTPSGTPPPRQRRSSLSDEMTPRDKARLFEQKRRDEMKKKQSLKESKREAELRRANEEERARERDQDRLEWAEKEMRMNVEAQREQDERRMREERLRMKQEAEDMERRERDRRESDKEHAAREARERREWEEREKTERQLREERDRRERERLEQERRAAEERKRMETDEMYVAEKKKKDAILQKLREIDEGAQKDKDPKADPFFVTEPMHERQESQESMSSRKSYKFSRPTENMHKGKPAQDITFTSAVNRRKDKIDVSTIESGGYNPSFTRKDENKPGANKTFSLFNDDATSTVSNKTEAKSKLLADLFGSRDTAKDDDGFGATKTPQKATASTNAKSMFPWDGSSSQKKSSQTGPKRENSSTLFAGGSALVNDEEFQQPKRSTLFTTRNSRNKLSTSTIHNKPTVRAIDDLDDELEEVIL